MKNHPFSTETRRNFISKAPARACGTLAILSQLRQAFADDMHVCLEPNKPDSILTKSCQSKLEATDQCDLLATMRDAPAFEELAAKLPQHIDLSDRELTVLYPASGAHLAPLMLAAKLVDAELIDRAIFTHTEIDPRTQDNITKNLRNICNTDPQFTFDENKITEEPHIRGKKIIFKLEYNGKPIQIHLLLDCCDGALFPDDEVAKHKIVISHDCIYTGIQGDFIVMREVLSAAKKHNTAPPPIILGDSDQSVSTYFGGLINSEEPYHRCFDLEAFGHLDKGTKPYGHRSFKECNGPREVGRSVYKQGGIFEFNDSILGLLSDEEFILLADILYKSKNALDAPSLDDQKLKLDSFSFFQSVVQKTPMIMEKLNRANPKIARAVAWRIFQNLYIFLIYNEFNRDLEMQYAGSQELIKAVSDLMQSLQQYLHRTDLFEVNKTQIPRIRAVTSAMVKATIRFKEDSAKRDVLIRELEKKYGDRDSIPDYVWFDLPNTYGRYDKTLDKVRPQSFSGQYRPLERMDTYGDKLFRGIIK